MLSVCRQAGVCASSSSRRRQREGLAQTSIPVTCAAARATGSACSNVPRNQSLLLATLTHLGYILLLHLWRALHFGGAALLVQRVRLLQCRQAALAALRLAPLWHAALPGLPGIGGPEAVHAAATVALLRSAGSCAQRGQCLECARILSQVPLQPGGLGGPLRMGSPVSVMLPAQPAEPSKWARGLPGGLATGLRQPT